MKEAKKIQLVKRQNGKLKDALRACDACQKRKTRCVMESDSCQYCRKRQIDCRFDSPVLKRGPRGKRKRPSEQLKARKEADLHKIRPLETSEQNASMSKSKFDGDDFTSALPNSHSLANPLVFTSSILENIDLSQMPLSSGITSDSLSIYSQTHYTQRILETLITNCVLLNLSQNEILLISDFLIEIYPNLPWGQSCLNSLTPEALLSKIIQCNDPLIRLAIIYAMSSITITYWNIRLSSWGDNNSTLGFLSESANYYSKSIGLRSMIKNSQLDLLFFLDFCIEYIMASTFPGTSYLQSSSSKTLI